MDDRITIRVPKKLLKSIDGYCAASGKGRSEAIRFLLERGAKEVSTRYSWNDQRADWTRLLRPVMRYFDNTARQVLDEAAKRIIDELYVAMAGLQDDFARTQQQQGDLIESIDGLQQQLNNSPVWSAELALTLAEVRGMTAALINEKNYDKRAFVDMAVSSARSIGKRLGVKSEVFPGHDSAPKA
ncbi:CopG family ribbon-helix-helix protein [Nevskia ramosa]|uniref:CopG family ribbon-helix-helix protein n=1 Tax=Nevskia ramosa TaxID=64002 RepID=UPI0003B60BEA|nr:ribbon-helix-helix domain-containing protein [Nevskia ramosa]